MSRINILDQSTANKIAAGEVVERPSSIVKELVENSIDAKASKITIEITDGGASLIKIIDNGTGIHADDIEKAFLPHATSKIKNIEDIFSINSLGFRGEALPSIAAVSKVTLRSKVKDLEYGREICIEGGTQSYITESGISEGTYIEVCDIFFNVPARKKFLKTMSREGSLINDIVTRIALSNPNIAFSLFSNNKKLLTTYGTGNIKDVIRSLYGKSVYDNIIEFDGTFENSRVYGFIGNEEIAKGSRNQQSIFVNGRYIKNRSVIVAVENAFKSFSAINKFPFFVLFINTPPEEIDVNIHPTKAEIKFTDERLIFKLIFNAVHTALRQESISRFIEPDVKDYKKEEIEELSFNIPDNNLYSYNNTDSGTSQTISGNISSKINSRSITSEKIILPEKNINSNLDIKNLYNTIHESDIKREEEIYNNLKNIKFNKGLDNNSSYDTNSVNSSTKLFNDNIIIKEGNYINTLDNKNINNTSISYIQSTESVNSSSDESNIKLKSDTNYNKISNEESISTAKFSKLKIIGQFKKMYILAEYGDDLYIIDQHAAHEKILFEKYFKEIENQNLIVQPVLVPTIIDLSLDDFSYYDENKDIFKEAGFNIEEFGGTTLSIKEVPYFLGKIDASRLFYDILSNLMNLGSGKTTEVKLNKIASMACRSAIKANDYLNITEMDRLIESLRFIDDPFHCPHGRPIILKFTEYELNKKFRRII